MAYDMDRRNFLKGGAALGVMAMTGGKGFSLDKYARSDEETDTKYWDLAKCKRAYLDYLTSKHEEIQEQQTSRQYRHGAQWTVAQVEVFNKRKQPVVTYNRISRKIDSIGGLLEKMKQDPKGYPANPRTTDEMAAELATSVVRHVVVAELRESRFPLAIENAAIDGIGGVEMLMVEGPNGDRDIAFAHVQTDSFFYDPRSYDHDFGDARFMGQAKWLDLDDAKDLAPDEETAQEIEDSCSTGLGSELTSSPDREKRWFDSDKDFKRVRVVEIWYKHEGGWCWALFTGSTKIDEGKSYFFNEKNQPICKFIMFSSFVDHDGDRYGFVRNLRSSQDEINQRRSKGLHELMSRRIKAEDGAFGDVEVTRREAVRPDGVVIYNKGFEMEFDDAARIANIEGQLKYLEDAKNEIENFGPNPALIGQGLEYKSGRAINLLQQAGVAELGPFVIGVKNWKLRLYRAIWCAVQRYWTAERFIKVTNVEGLEQMISVNGIGVDEMGLPRMINAVGQLDVNFILDEGPDEVNMMADAYDTLVALTAQGANIPPQVLLELAPLQHTVKKKLLALLEKPDPMAEQAKQIALQAEGAKVKETDSKTALNMAKAQEVGQGGEYTMQERQMDAQLREREFQLKAAESAQKVQGKRQETEIKLQGEFAKLQSQRVKSQFDLAASREKSQQEMMANRQKTQMDLQTNQMKSMMGLRQTEEKHRQDLRMQAQRPKPQGGSNATVRSQ